MNGESEQFAVRHRLMILFVTLAVCLAGVFAAMEMPSSVFPETEFPRVVVLVDNGVMPEDEMMARITRPIEEAVKDIPGVVQVRSGTGRGSAEVNVFFDWDTDMARSELYVLTRLAQLKADLPATTKSTVWRLTFNAFPIIGVSMTSAERDLTELWEMARYDLKPRLLRIPGIARVDLVGGRRPEYHVVVDPEKLAGLNMTFQEVSDALLRNNIVQPAGYHTENYTLYLTVVDNRSRGPEDLEQLVVRVDGDVPIRVRDFARVERGPEPVFNVVNADGQRAVLLNIRAQPTGSDILQIARDLKRQIASVRQSLPPDVAIASYYDQSLFVQESVASVWEAICVGLLFAVVILYGFLRNWGSVTTAIVVIPVSILATVVVMLAARMTFNLMTLGGIAAAIGLIIDDAIVVVEAIHAELVRGRSRAEAVRLGMASILRPLVGSTLTPVVVFLPLAFLDGLPGVFFRALAMTMVAALLASFFIAISLTPTLASIFLRERSPEAGGRPGEEPRGILLGPLLGAFEWALRGALRRRWIPFLACVAIAYGGWRLQAGLPSEFLPEMDEAGFVIDYKAPWGTSLEETDRVLRLAEDILRDTPEVESYSRRTGARLALGIAEPNSGDMLVKLHSDHARSTEAVKIELRRRFNQAFPLLEWEFPGILGDLIGDLTWSPDPIEIKLFSNDSAWLERKAPEVQAALEEIPGVVDTNAGLVSTGPSIRLRIHQEVAARLGFTADDIARALHAAMLGQLSSSVLEGDRVLEVRVQTALGAAPEWSGLSDLPLRAPGGELVKLSQLAEVSEGPGQVELHREDLRQLVAVTGRLEGRDLGSAIADIKEMLAQDPSLPQGSVELGGLYKEQQGAFRNLLVVLGLGIVLVFSVLLMEFRTLAAPLAIVAGSLLALSGTACALELTGTSLNIVSFLGAIIGVGIVAKNGILMLDSVGGRMERGASLNEALVGAGCVRLRPILMTSLSTVLAMAPLAWGIGHGSDMLRPLAIAIIGALCVSMLFSLIATPVLYSLMREPLRR